MATTPPISVSFTGDWMAKGYAPGVIVNADDALYLCVVRHTTPCRPPSDAAHWSPLGGDAGLLIVVDALVALVGRLYAAVQFLGLDAAEFDPIPMP